MWFELPNLSDYQTICVFHTYISSKKWTITNFLLNKYSIGLQYCTMSLEQISVTWKQKGFYIRCDQSILYQKEHLNKHAWWWIDGRRLTGRHKIGDSDGTSIPRLIFFLKRVLLGTCNEQVQKDWGRWWACII